MNHDGVERAVNHQGVRDSQHHIAMLNDQRLGLGEGEHQIGVDGRLRRADQTRQRAGPRRSSSHVGAEAYGLKSDTVSDLSLGALDDLASSSAEVQAEVERRIAAGEIVSAAGLQADQLFLHRAAEETISPTQEVILAGCEVSMKRSLVKLPSTSAKPSAATVHASYLHPRHLFYRQHPSLTPAILLPGGSASILRG